MGEQPSSNENNIPRYSQISRNRRPVNTRDSKSSTSTLIVVFSLIAVSIIGFYWLMNSKESTDESTEQETNDTEEISIDDQDESDSNESDSPAEEQDAIDASEKSSDTDAQDAPLDENFSTNDQTIGDESISGAKITGFDQEAYEGFLRIFFTIESDNGVPYTTASIIQDSNLINLKVTGLDEDTSGITRGTGFDVTGSVVSTVFHEVTSEENLGWYKIGIKESTNFYLHASEDGDKIILDIQEKEIENGNGEEFEFSTESQSFDGDAEGNVITVSGLSHSDQPSEGVFRIILRLGTIGTGTIPSARAEIVDYEGGKAVKLEVSNMYSDFAAEDNYTEDYGNKAVNSMTGSFSENVSTYYIKITSEREYKLYYREAPAQLIVDVRL